MNFSSLITDRKNHQSPWLIDAWVKVALTPTLFINSFPALKEETVLPPKKERSYDFLFRPNFFSFLPCESYDNLFVEWRKLPESTCHYYDLTYLDLNWDLDFHLHSLEAEVQHRYNKIEQWFSETPDTIFNSEDWLRQVDEKIQHIQKSIAGILNRVRAMRRALSSFSTLKLDFRLTIRKKTCVVFKVLDDEHIIER